ncbi:hypothetical protein [Luteibaculum oceani]|uniref:Uncharacterized protein n=1 Tax=Luteibaculum oceani TaxID=1294296 RepID=A0A5C6USM6_9FLAO|nr:hypothetical protein [Luteibaculum oceani]TXC76257.1 hypothetical protein FRX97_10955 [Luteibaculum oceani]
MNFVASGLKPNIYALVGLLTLYLGGIGSVFAQEDYTWWNNKHNWDGTTHWQRYLIVSPNFFGPNALPVPEIHQGTLPSAASFTASINQHFGRGNSTTNPFFSFQTPLYSKKVGLEISMVPIEYFKMDTITRDERRVRDRDGKGWTAGDVHISTQIKLLDANDRRPDISLLIHLKTASGGGLGAARYTDTPGYHFAFSVGKTSNPVSKSLQSYRWYSIVGFMAYQTYRTDYRQNDALIYGVGNQIQTKSLNLQTELGGYFGYINNGDRPLLLRIKLEGKLGNWKKVFFQFQQGLHDFPYSSITIGRKIATPSPFKSN